MAPTTTYSWLTFCAIALLVFAADCAKPPNIIFILSDDLGYGDVSISPMVNRTHEIPTPNIQRLADEGMRFLRGYSGQVCAPSRCTLMTGHHSGHCTVRGNDGSYSPLLETDRTVGHVLNQAYETGVVGKWGLGDFNTTGYPLQQGFDHYIGQASQVSCHNWYPGKIQNNTLGNYTIEANFKASEAACGPHHSKCTWANDLFNREAIRFIQEHGGPSAEKPFFLFFSTTTPHTGFLAGAKTQWAVPGPYDTRFPQYDAVQAAFAAATSAQDDFVGAVLDELKVLNIDDNTIVFFSGDNGPDSHPFTEFDDPGPFRGKKRSLHEGGIRQTIVARWPGRVAANTTTDHLFTFWDFLPTAADLGGVPAPEGVDGVSAAPVLLGQADKQKQHDYLYWEFCDYGRVDGLLPQLYDPGWIQAIRYDTADGTTGTRTEWKGIRTHRGPMLLFNLTDDISETTNVSDKFPDIVEKIATFMEQAHVENRFWKSSRNASDRCCGSCFSHKGCKAPCVQLNTSIGAHSPIVDSLSPPLRFLSDHYLLGNWHTISVQDSDDDIGIASPPDVNVRLSTARNQAAVHSPSDLCHHGGTMQAASDPKTGTLVVTVSQSPMVFSSSSPKCDTVKRGTVHTDGNRLFLLWGGDTSTLDQSPSHKSSAWMKPEFDYD